MAELLSPGIFIEERTSQVQQITAVSTSNFATIGWTPKGPENEAVLITSLEQFFNTFGAFTKYSDLAYAMTGFFQNGGARAFVVRVAPDDAVVADASVSGGSWDFVASSRGAWGNLLKLVITGNKNYYDVNTATYSRFDVAVQEETVDGGAEVSTVEFFEGLVLDNEDSAQYILDVLNNDSTGSDLVVISEGIGGIPTQFESVQVSNESIGSGTGLQQYFNATLAQPVIAESTLKIKVNGTLVGEDDGEGSIEGSGVTGAIDYETGSLQIFFVAAPAGGASITADYYQAGVEEITLDFVNGSDGDPSAIGRNQISAASLAATDDGIYAFNEVDEFLNLGIADFSDDKTISLDVIAYAEQRKDIFVILDCGEGKTAQQALKYKRNLLGSLSEYAAVYWPRIKVADELKDGIPKIISPVGHIAGCYARTDIEKNVGKSPGGLDDGQLNGILELEFRTTKGDRDLIYPGAINPLREDAYVGRAIWGVKTLAITGDFTRINARRLFIFLEKSTFNSTHDLVFENIGAQLWAKIKLRMDGFLSVLFEDGYFRGDTPEQAYRVVVDESNNPPAVVNARQVLVDIYISINEPGEYIRFRYQRQFPES